MTIVFLCVRTFCIESFFVFGFGVFFFLFLNFNFFFLDSKPKHLNMNLWPGLLPCLVVIRAEDNS